MSIIANRYHYESVDYAIKKRRKTDQIYDRYLPQTMLNEMSADDLYAILAAAENEDFSVRAALEEKEFARAGSPDYVEGDLCMKDFPVEISFDGTIVTIKTPVTISRKSKEQKLARADFLLAEAVNAAFEKWRIDHPDLNFRAYKPFHSDDKLLLLIVRKALRFNRNRHCDDDNIECSRVQNAICNGLLISDNCAVLSIMKHFETTKNESECGTIFKIGRMKDLLCEIEKCDMTITKAPPTRPPRDLL